MEELVEFLGCHYRIDYDNIWISVPFYGELGTILWSYIHHGASATYKLHMIENMIQQGLVSRKDAKKLLGF